LHYSEDIFFGYWSKVNFTYNTATTGTFTALGGYCKQTAAWTDEASTFTYKFQARRITGNTNLQILTEGAPEGNKTPVTLTGSLAWYSVTFTGVAGTEIVVGIQDDNAAGHGQIEITQQHVYRSDHDGNYLSTLSQPHGGQRNGVPVWQCGSVNNGSYYYVPAANRNNAQPFTIYGSCYLRNTVTGDGGVPPNDRAWLFTGSNPTIWGQILAFDNTNLHLDSYVNLAPFTWQASTDVVAAGAWHIFTIVFNGASSKIRLNKNAEVNVNLPVPPNMNTLQIGCEAFGNGRSATDWHEVITRFTADNTATQDTFIDYMAGQVGLSV
jgi:hypothetical protein